MSLKTYIMGLDLDNIERLISLNYDTKNNLYYTLEYDVDIMVI